MKKIVELNDQFYLDGDFIRPGKMRWLVLKTGQKYSKSKKLRDMPAIPVMTLNVYKRRRVFLMFRNNFMILRAFIRHIISQINDGRQYSFRQLGHKQNHKAGIAGDMQLVPVILTSISLDDIRDRVKNAKKSEILEKLIVTGCPKTHPIKQFLFLIDIFCISHVHLVFKCVFILINSLRSINYFIQFYSNNRHQSTSLSTLELYIT